MFLQIFQARGLYSWSEDSLLREDAMKTLTWTNALLLLLFLLLFFMAIYRLDTYPPVAFDEGVHLIVAQKLALGGKYRFGPAVGPTVFYPIALAFRAGGVGLLPARVVMAGYLLLCAAVFYALTRYLAGWKAAAIGTLLLMVSPGANLLFWGRQVIGEVPAALFFLAGTLTWFKTLGETRPGRRRGKLILAGIFFGLAIITKNQFLLWLPAWCLLWALDRLYYRQLSHTDTALPLASTMVCVAAWYLGQRLFLSAGSELAAANVKEWSNAVNRGMFTLSLQRMMDGVKLLTSQDALYAWGLPAALYAALLSLRRSQEGVRWGWLTLATLVWLGWFVGVSVAWPRYAFLALVITTLFAAKLFHDLTAGYHIPVRAVVEKMRSGKWDTHLATRIALMALLLILILRPLQGRLGEIISRQDRTPQQMAAYIIGHLPQGAQIETYEPEVCFLSGYSCHMPPSEVMDASIRYVWYGDQPPSEYYHLQDLNAPYLLIGDFGRLVHAYDPDVVQRNYELETTIGSYELYRAKAH
jgi:hypothetical protein